MYMSCSLLSHPHTALHVHVHVDLQIEAQEYKVYPGTEQEIYNDTFFSRQDLVVNALDNVEARRYVDR